ncbi:hypothetical protein C8J56DRAFT_822279, partial [Mycena floridula]
MSHSTTSTSRFILQKYSKSYPKSHNTNVYGNDSATDWQHFTNPVIRLILDIRKASGDGSGELESVRMRIQWSMSEDGSEQQNDVVFEDLDLLTFSALPMNNKPQKKSAAQSLPLKAVYRDSVVGIRYLHPREFSPNPSYRRFQMTFTSAFSASQFIESIRTVCPCKANPGPGETNVNVGQMNPPIPMHSENHGFSVPPQRYNPFHPNAIVAGPSVPFSVPATPRRHQIISSSPIHKEMASPHVANNMLFNNHNFSFNQNRHQQYIQSDPDDIQGVVSVPPFPPNGQQPQATESQRSYPSHPSSSMPSSSLPPPMKPTLTHNLSSSTLAPSSSELQETDQARMLAALQQATGLYSLPIAALETLVGDIIREDGFERLMENLSSMW